MENKSLIIRSARLDDVSVIYRFLCELSQYEKSLQTTDDNIIPAESDLLHQMLFVDHSIECLVAQLNNEPVGIAVFHFYRLAGWSGRYVIYLESLYASEMNRKSGIGIALIKELCRIAKKTMYKN